MPGQGREADANGKGRPDANVDDVLTYRTVASVGFPRNRAVSIQQTMKRADFPFFGFGVGLRRQHYSHILETRPQMDWFEVISENFMVEGGRPLQVLERIRANYPIVFHGVSLSIGSTDRLNRKYLRDLRTLVDRFEPAWVSDHLCWTSVGGHNTHDLLPLPCTEDVVHHVAGRVREAQETLERRILLENVSSYMSFVQSTMSEWEFLSAVAEEADCGILLDINNIFVSAFNHGFNAERYIDSVPIERVVQFHLAGHSDHGTYLLDSHDHPVREEVWKLYERAVRRFGVVSALVEWDENIPEFDVLSAIAEQARRRCARSESSQEDKHENRAVVAAEARLSVDR